MAGRSTSRSRPGICSAPPRTSREATDRNGTSSRPPGRQITSSTRSRSPAASGKLSRRPAGGCGRTLPRPAPAPYRCPDHAAAPTAARGIGRVGVYLHPHLASWARTSQMPAASSPVNTCPNKLVPVPARSPQRHGPAGGPGRRGTPHSPLSTSGPSPHPLAGPVGERGHHDLPGRAILPDNLNPPAIAGGHVADPQHRRPRHTPTPETACSPTACQGGFLPPATPRSLSRNSSVSTCSQPATARSLAAAPRQPGNRRGAR